MHCVCDKEKDHIDAWGNQLKFIQERQHTFTPNKLFEGPRRGFMTFLFYVGNATWELYPPLPHTLVLFIGCFTRWVDEASRRVLMKVKGGPLCLWESLWAQWHASVVLFPGAPESRGLRI